MISILTPGTARHLVLGAALVLAACATAQPARPDGAPAFRGVVAEVTHHATGSGVRADPLTGGAACGLVATVDAATRVLRRASDGSLDAVGAEAVSVGDTVEVYASGPVAESCPMQARAAALVLTAGAERVSAERPDAGATAPACPTSLPLGVFAYDASAPLGYADRLLAVEDGVELRAFSFDSPRGGRASGVLAVPQAAGPQAGLVALTGFPVRPDADRAYVARLARRGAVVALLWAPSARPDGMGDGSPVTFTVADSVGQVQYAVDARRTVDLLLARSDVDPERLALVGGSYGGAIGALVAGLEPRLRAAALRSADGGFVAYFTDPAGPGLPDDLAVADRARWLAAMTSVAPLCYVGRARAALLFQWGRQDPLVSAARADALAAQAPDGREVRWYDAGHRLTDAAEAERMQWLDAHVGTHAPTP